MGSRGPLSTRRSPARRPSSRGPRRLPRRLPRPDPVGLLAASCVLGLVVLALAPVAPIPGVEVRGNRHVAAETAVLASGLDRSPAFRASAAEARSRLRSLPAVRDATVDLVLGGPARVTLREREAAGRWIGAGLEWFVDASGVVFASVDAAAAPDLRVTDERVAAGRALAGDRIDPALVAAAFRLASFAPGELRGDLVQPRVVVTAGPAGLVLRSGSGWEIRFGSPESFTDKLSRARQFLKENPERRLDYLDVRSPDHIVYFPN